MNARGSERPLPQEPRSPLDWQPQERLLRLRHVLEVLQISRAHLYDLIAAGQFPRALKIGKAACWPESRVNAWLSAKMAEADRVDAAPRPLTAEQTAKITVGTDTG